ncbi:MAG: hypothetical protein COV70_02095 [Parcubacteria group bacterium CG11_big_fil_rev_8_21_14_0_20_39_22]|nr:MAG: hypothetical protein COV70_02095 [Parcubacteria group bacterium CG11_big_fil_rev_8_21_14_0_20_39_22]
MNPRYYTIIIAIVILVGGIFAFNHWSKPDTSNNDDTSMSEENNEGIACAQDVRECSDGSFVSRVAPSCTFANCPEGTTLLPTDEIDSESTTTEDDATEIIYDGNNFSPDSVTIGQGDTVRFVNKSNRPMWVGSDLHPTHTIYGGTSLREHCPSTGNTAFDQCESVGEDGVYEFTFDKTGKWGYHNHVSASASGEIIVQ